MFSGYKHGIQTSTDVLTGDAAQAINGNFTTIGDLFDTALATVSNNNTSLDIGITIDGGGSVISSGTLGFRQCNFNATITSWTLIAAQSGSVVFDIKKSSYAGFPTTTSITASAKPTLSSAQNSTSSSLSGWTTAINAGDVLEFDVSSVSTITRVTLILHVTRGS